MDTYKVKIFPAAEADLHNIFIYIKEKLISPNTALKIYNDLFQTIISLEVYPTRAVYEKLVNIVIKDTDSSFIKITLSFMQLKIMKKKYISLP